MWNNKEIKASARQALKRNYWIIVLICAVLVFLSIIPGSGTSILDLQNTGSTTEVSAENVADDSYTPGLIRYLDALFESKEKAAAIANQVMNSFEGTGGNVYGIMKFIDKMAFSNGTVTVIMVILLALARMFYTFVFSNVVNVGFRRILQDAHKSKDKINFMHLFTMFKVNGFWNIVLVMIYQSFIPDIMGLSVVLILVAGGFLIVKESVLAGGIICMVIGLGLIVLQIYLTYSFAMIPYILSDNPKAKLKEAVTLSRSMMKGNYLHFFGLRLSFFGWYLLSAVTFGLLDLFYVTPYRNLTEGKLFLELRKYALDNNLPYSYIVESDSLTTAPEALQPNKLGEIIADRNPMRKYSILNYILLFFIFAFIGWCWEVLLHIVKDGEFINRGTMHGPWLPIYGSGGVLIILFLRRFAKKPALLFCSTFVLCGVLEYATSYVLELTKGIRWWDYSNYFLNINGRVCLEGLLIFSIGGFLFVYVAGPALDNLLNRIPKKIRITAAIILCTAFGADLVYSHYFPNTGKGITDYKRNNQN